MRELILLALFCGALSSVIFDQRYDLAIDNYEDIGGLEEVEMLLSVEKYVFFLLYTKKNPLISQKLEFNVDGIENSNYDKLKNTKFIIHGWRNDGGSRINVLIRDAYLKSFDVNVIVVDWGQVAHSVSDYFSFFVNSLQ